MSYQGEDLRRWGGGGFKVDYNPAKTNLQDHARLCKNLACKTCLARARDMSLFLHDSCTILHISCKKSVVQDFARDVARIITCKFAQFFARSCKNCARLCKNHARKGTYRVHVPSKSYMQDSCTILHDLASSFLLGRVTVDSDSAMLDRQCRDYV